MTTVLFQYENNLEYPRYYLGKVALPYIFSLIQFHVRNFYSVRGGGRRERQEIGLNGPGEFKYVAP